MALTRGADDTEEVALLSEIVSGFAVFATLVVLLLEVQTNTDVQIANAYERNSQSLIEHRATVLQDEDALRVWNAYFDDVEYRDLSSMDRRRLHLLTSSIWLIYDESFGAYRPGLLGEQEWSRMLRADCNRYLSRTESWEDGIQDQVTARFGRYVQDSCTQSLIEWLESRATSSSLR